MSDDDKIRALCKAVDYLLNRIQSDANMNYYASFGTRSFEVLCEAQAAATGESLGEVMERRRKWLGGSGKSDTELIRGRLDKAVRRAETLGVYDKVFGEEEVSE